MKKIITLILASSMLAASVPAVIADEDLGSLTLDKASALAVADDGYIENMPDGMAVSELVSNFRDPKNVTVKSASGEVLGLFDIPGSDAVVSYASGDVTAKTWMTGDTNRDGQVNAKDVSGMVKSQAGYSVDMCTRAADVNADGVANSKDIAQVMKKVAGWDVTIAKPAYAGEITEFEDAGIKLLFSDVMCRYGQSDTTIEDGLTDRVYRMAKNEIETAQIVITSDADHAGMTLEFTDLVNENGAKLECEYKVGYYYQFDMLNKMEGCDWNDIESDFFVEPFLTLNEAFDLGANQSKIFAVRIHSTADSEAGMYSAQVSLKNADGQVVKTGKLRVYVWDFTLSEKTASASAFGLGRNSIVNEVINRYGDYATLSAMKTQEEIGVMIDEEMVKWTDYMLDNRLTPYHLPYSNVDDPRNDPYVNNPRVTSFCIWGGNAAPTYDESYDKLDDLADMYRRHKDDATWLDKAYVYVVDEPCEWSQFDFMDRFWQGMSERLGDIPFQVVTPLAMNKYDANHPEYLDFAERTAHSTNILCPQIYAFSPYATPEMRKLDPYEYPGYAKDFSGGRHGYEKYGEFRDRYEAWRETGDYKMWWYNCVSPGYPYSNYFNSYRGVCSRVMLWQQYYFDIDGFLYWAVDFWVRAEHDTVQISKRKLGSGDGLFLYPASLFRSEDIVPSVRLEYLRDSFEDFQYMSQLEEFIGKEAVLEYVTKVTHGMLQYTEDPEVLAGARDQLGFMLENVSK